MYTTGKKTRRQYTYSMAHRTGLPQSCLTSFLFGSFQALHFSNAVCAEKKKSSRGCKALWPAARRLYGLIRGKECRRSGRFCELKCLFGALPTFLEHRPAIPARLPLFQRRFCMKMALFHAAFRISNTLKRSNAYMAALADN